MTQKENVAKRTPKSQAGVLRQEIVEGQREDLHGRIARLKSKTAELEQKRDLSAEKALEPMGSGQAPQNIMAEIRVATDELKLWEAQLARVEKEFAALTPSPKSAAEREKSQEALANLADQRLALDEGIDTAVLQVKDLLQKRRELTSRMADVAQALELEVDFDQARFEDFEASLPGKMAPQSQDWAGLLLGRQTPPVRAFARKRIVLPETLTNTGIYNPGDELHLSTEQFAELHRGNRPDSTSEAPWQCQPPDVFTVEEYETARAEAKKKGITLEEVVFWQDMQAWEESKKAHYARDAVMQSGGGPSAPVYLTR